MVKTGLVPPEDEKCCPVTDASLSSEHLSSDGARAQNAAELIALLDAIFATRTRDAWGEVFAKEKDFWWAPVQSVDEVLADPQVAACGGLVPVPDGASTTPFPATPVDFSGTPWAPRAMAPALGQHTDEILAELGRSADAVAALRRDGVVA